MLGEPITPRAVVVKEQLNLIRVGELFHEGPKKQPNWMLAKISREESEPEGTLPRGEGPRWCTTNLLTGPGIGQLARGDGREARLIGQGHQMVNTGWKQLVERERFWLAESLQPNRGQGAQHFGVVRLELMTPLQQGFRLVKLTGLKEQIHQIHDGIQVVSIATQQGV
jgi:hypothetical protein